MRFCGTVFSKVLEMDTGLTVVAPNELRDGAYKVAYLLHGACGDSRTWLDYSLLPVYASGGDTVYILPEAGRSFYADMVHGFRYFTYITQELPRLCENLFRISARREDTVVMGGSMGGYGALKCALTYPERYGRCAAFSSGCLFLNEGLAALRKDGVTEEFIKSFGEQLPHDFSAIFGADFAPSDAGDLPTLAQKAKSRGTLPQLYLTCGTQDPFFADNLRFCDMLKKEGVALDFEQWPARHDFLYFNDALKKAIDRFGL